MEYRQKFFRLFKIRQPVTIILACVAGLMSAACSQNSSHPNIVLIFADDLGYCDSELYGCNTVPTPNIKRLATEGALFTSGYVTSPVCSPSRASMLTGRYQQRFGHEFLPEGDPSGDAGLPVSEKTIANYLKMSGYTTGMTGKWHLGDNEEFHPLNRGFDEWFGIITAATDYADPTRTDVKSFDFQNYIAKKALEKKIPTSELSEMTSNQIINTLKEQGLHDMANWLNSSSSDSTWKGRGAGSVFKGRQIVNEPDYLTDAFSREAVAFIRRYKDKPFFLYIPYTATHGPLQVTQKYYDRFPYIGNEQKRIYAAMTASLDDGIGSILDALAETGLEENTLVIFLSDNGAGVADYASNAPLRLGKHTLFEGGVRVPFTIKWPKQISKGKVYHNPVSSLDILPTVIAAAGGKIPSEASIEGVDLLPYLDGSINLTPHNKLYWRNGANWAIREGDWKLIYAGERYWLYDLSDDIGEIHNLANERSDIVTRMTDLYRLWDQDNIPPAWPAVGSKKADYYFVDGIEIDWAL